jgi:hypothetical protein
MTCNIIQKYRLLNVVLFFSKLEMKQLLIFMKRFRQVFLRHHRDKFAISKPFLKIFFLQKGYQSRQY